MSWVVIYRAPNGKLRVAFDEFWPHSELREFPDRAAAMRYVERELWPDVEYLIVEVPHVQPARG